MAVTCSIRYEIDPFQHEAFEEPARRRLGIVPADEAGAANVRFAQTARFLQREERASLRPVEVGR